MPLSAPERGRPGSAICPGVRAVLITAMLEVAAAVVVVPAAAAAQQPVPVPASSPAARGAAFTTAFLLRRGTDTVTIERVNRAAARFQGEIDARRSGRVVYAATVAPDGLVPRVELTLVAPGATMPTGHAVVTLRGDSAIADLGGGRIQRIATRVGALPWVNPSMAFLEQAVRRMRVLGGSGVTIPMINLVGGATTPVTVSAAPGDSVVVSFVDVQIRVRVAPDGRVLGGVIPSQGFTIERVEGARVASLRFTPPDYSAPAGAPYRAEEVRVPTGSGVMLAGTLTIPAGPAAAGRPPFPAVVTITGSGLEDRDEALPIVPGYRPFRDLADTLSRRGVAVLRLDDRGFGGSSGNASNATTADFADDVRAALEYLRRRPDIDPRRLFLLGHSEGGMIAPMVAATDPALRGIVLMAGPSRTGRDILRWQIRYEVEHDSTLRTPQARAAALAAGEQRVDSIATQQAWLRYFAAYDPAPTARQVRVPVLILQGATDQQVTPDQADELAADFRADANRDVTVRVFPGLNHLFLPDPSGNPIRYGALTVRQLPAEVRGAVADWVVARARR